MKKLKLEDLEVTSFAAENLREDTGTVNGLQSGYATYCNRSCYETECFCTREAGCYPSLYCSQGYPELTCAMDCMTNANGYC